MRGVNGMWKASDKNDRSFHFHEAHIFPYCVSRGVCEGDDLQTTPVAVPEFVLLVGGSAHGVEFCRLILGLFVGWCQRRLYELLIEKEMAVKT
jgi:hypothetical protein